MFFRWGSWFWQLAEIFREKRKSASTLGSDRVRRSYSGGLVYYWYLLAGQIWKANSRWARRTSSIYFPPDLIPFSFVCSFPDGEHHQGSYRQSKMRANPTENRKCSFSELSWSLPFIFGLQVGTNSTSKPQNMSAQLGRSPEYSHFFVSRGRFPLVARTNRPIEKTHIFQKKSNIFFQNGKFSRKNQNFPIGFF